MDGTLGTNILFAVGSAVVSVLQAVIIGALRGLKNKIDGLCTQQTKDRDAANLRLYMHKHTDNGDVVVAPEALN